MCGGEVDQRLGNKTEEQTKIWLNVFLFHCIKADL